MQEVKLIDANALHKRIEMNLRASNPFTIEECCYKDALNSVDEAPAIDPESLRPVAHWENDPNGAGSDVFSCSNCCERICLEDQGYFPEMDYKFCPYCGARIENVE